MPWRLLCAVLLLGLILTSWRAYALDGERDAISEALSGERAARLKAEASASGLEMRFANYVLESRVRRDIVDERMATQELRSAELDQEAEAVREQKLLEADCITPRSVLNAAGL